MLNRLIDNAFDFLRKATEDLENDPKFSVIHFHAAVELFLKARLMKEHWSLVISQRQQPDWNKFISGDFQSISLDGAAERLEKVVRSGLTKSELKSFREVTKHRNKVVHFFHEAHSDEENQEQVRLIVKQQLTAWYFLHHLMTNRWKETFNKWEDKIIAIDKKLMSLHTFLQISYDQLKPEIEKKRAVGILFKNCPSCGFKAQDTISEQKKLHTSKCLVCCLSEKAIKISCPSCEEEVTFIDEGFARCDGCGDSFEPEHLADEMIDGGAAHIAAMDGDNSYDPGNCSDCEGYHTVVRTEDDEFICTSCFLVCEHLQNCHWCGEPNTGDMEYSMWKGCGICDGRAGWDKD